MRILMVTPYPPNRDGIAAYAVQAVRALRTQGHDVEVLSAGPSAAHHHLDLVGPRGALALARRVRGYDRVVVQFHPDFFYPLHASPWRRTQVSLALAVAFRRARSVEVVIHEIDGRHGRRRSLDGQAARLLWRSVDRIHVHTDGEREDFARDFGVPAARIAVTDHGAAFVPRTHHDRASARASLGVPEGDFVFLSIGFIQPHKGFDRAVRAFAGLAAAGARLDVVGSLRVEDPGFVAYRDELAALVAATDGAHLHEGFVSDELFDRWIVAADAVVLPYRSIWSSGVLERALLYGRPVIATSVGGLAEQAGMAGDGSGAPTVQTVSTAPSGPDGSVPAAGGPDGQARFGGRSVTLVADDAELAAAMRAAVGADGVLGVFTVEPWPIEGDNLRARIQGEVVVRAAAARGARTPVAAPGATPPDGRTVDGEQSDRHAAAVTTASLLSAPLRRVGTLDLPAPTSDRVLARLAKRVVRRLTAWEVEPLVHHLNRLRSAAVDALEAVAVPAGTTPAAQSGGSATRAAGTRPAVQDGDRSNP